METTEGLELILKVDDLVFLFIYLLFLFADLLSRHIKERKHSILGANEQVLVRLGVHHEVGGALGLLWKLCLEVVLLVDLILDRDVLVLGLCVLIGVFNLVPVDKSTDLRHNDVLGSHDGAKRLGLEIEGVSDMGVLRGDVEKFVLVRAEKDTVLTVPSQGGEVDAGVVAFNNGHIHGVELFDLEAPGVNEVLTAIIALLLVDLAIVLVDELEGGQDGVELDLLSRKDAEFVL